jgi:hypothetical protein
MTTTASAAHSVGQMPSEIRIVLGAMSGATRSTDDERGAPDEHRTARGRDGAAGREHLALAVVPVYGAPLPRASAGTRTSRS